MPLKKKCSKMGCNTLVDVSLKYCKEHKDTQKQRHREYKQKRRDKEEQRFYNRKPWKDTRELVLMRDNGLCQLSLENNEIVFASMVHHIIPMKENSSRKLDPKNLISLSNGMHNYVESQYDKGEDSKEKMQEKLFEIVKNKYKK
ncbi:HNH endonuclease [Clostridium sp. D2Q-11]|uniref:HNH endonuclease n=1 Tax=Anaeromonas frigoriresistens TaxID=2683708 RepID=A0A942ZA38_9FIRM|nr:HNH endonuclease [Anaeromonas frigoriresistens]MBS4539814.1 HNH endonuclease [Anaeromonas frigoriresistens]